ncbi:MAG: HNH endonuclease [Clostridia bacterium]|nr:HNH endonuclease [Clostridia bacterium]
MEFENYNDFVKVSRNGDILRLANGEWTTPPLYDTNGYLMFVVTENGKQKRRYVHRVVAETFLKRSDDSLIVNHLDGDKHNNKAENLEWCTYSQNTIHAYGLGLFNLYTDKKCPYCNEQLGRSAKNLYHIHCKEKADYERKQMRAANLQRILNKVAEPSNTKERNEIILRFVQMGCTLQSVGNKFGITKERVRQIVSKNDVSRKRTNFVKRRADDQRVMQAAWM